MCGGTHSRVVGNKTMEGAVVDNQHGPSEFKVYIKSSLKYSLREGGEYAFLCASEKKGTG